MMAKRRIMIIDDEEDFLKLVKLNLENTGKFEVMCLPSAKEITTHLHNFNPDLILLDLLMSGAGGIEVCDILNNDPVGQEVPVIILSALSKKADKLNAFKKGVVGYLVKPVESHELISEIEKALQAKYET